MTMTMEKLLHHRTCVENAQPENLCLQTANRPFTTMKRKLQRGAGTQSPTAITGTLQSLHPELLHPIEITKPKYCTLRTVNCRPLN